MLKRFLLMLLLLVAVLLLIVDSEREYRHLQALQARQVYQKQVLLEEQSQLRLELQKALLDNSL